MPWLAGKTWSGSRLCNSPYWDELVFHAVLSTGSVNINLWDADTSQTQADCAAVDRNLATIAGQAGNSPTLTPLDVECGARMARRFSCPAARCSNGRLVARVTVAATQPSDQTAKVGVSGLPASVMVKAGDVGAWVTQ